MELLSIIYNIVFDFFLAVFLYLVFYLIGSLGLKSIKIKVSGFNNLYANTLIGIFLFALVSYILAWINLRILLLPILIILAIYKFKKQEFKIPKFEIKDKTYFILVIFLAFIFSITMVGMGIYGSTIAYRSEDPLHLAYISELKNNFPPQNPGFAGVPLRGYHFFYQFIIASVSKTFFLPIEALYFHSFPLIISFTWAVGVYGLVLTWTKRKTAALWATFFSLFGGSWAFILYLMGHTKQSIDSAFGIGQPTVALMNPQFAFSVPVIITAFYFIFEFYKSRKYKILLPVVLLVGMLPLEKIYGGVVLYGGFSIVILSEIIRRKFVVLIYLIAAIILTLLTFGLFLGKGQYLIYYPLWPSHTVLEDNLPWYGYAEKSYTYTRQGVIRGIIEIESFGLMLYFIGNIGTRIIGIVIALLVQPFKRRFPSLFSLTLLASTATAVLIPLFFIQTGKVFETIQFAWYYPILCSFFAGLGLSYLFDLKFPRFIKAILILLIVLLTIPPAVDHFVKAAIPEIFKKRESLNSSYFRGLQTLKGVGSYNDTVLHIPPVYVNADRVGDWFFRTSPFITGFGNKKTYADYELIVFENVHPEKRMPLIENVISFNNANEKDRLQDLLKKEKIKFIYSERELPILVKVDLLEEIFRGDKSYIYKIR